MNVNIAPEYIEAFPYTQQPAIIKHYQNTNNSTDTISVSDYVDLSLDAKSKYIPIYFVDGRDGRILSEDNLALLISKLTNNSSYVISDDVPGDAGVFEFILKGRYFKINKAGYDTLTSDEVPDNFSTSSNIYANIVLEQEIYPGYAVMKSASATVFNGINFTDTPAVGALHLLTKSGSTWVIPTASKFRFNSNVISLIDGGTV